MEWSRLSRVAFMFPDDNPEAQAFFEQLEALLKGDANSTINEDLILVTPIRPPGALPVTSLELAGNLAIPKLVLETDLPIEVRAGNFYVHSSDVVADTPFEPQPEAGEQRSLMPMAELVERFEGHVLQLHHSGLNIPQSRLERADWDLLLGSLGLVSNLYQYPGGKELYFVLPCTPEEQESGIIEFMRGRDPKFELVYDAYESVPLVQFNLTTDLSREEVEDRLPEPYGISHESLADRFRAVYVQHPWPDLHIRFDLSFREERAAASGSFDEWLVTQGRRVVGR